MTCETFSRGTDVGAEQLSLFVRPQRLPGGCATSRL